MVGAAVGCGRSEAERAAASRDSTHACVIRVEYVETETAQLDFVILTHAKAHRTQLNEHLRTILQMHTARAHFNRLSSPYNTARVLNAPCQCRVKNGRSRFCQCCENKVVADNVRLSERTTARTRLRIY